MKRVTPAEIIIQKAKAIELKELKMQAESFYKLNRLMTKLVHRMGGSDLQIQYEDALFELGRLKGVEQALQMTSSLAE